MRKQLFSLLCTASFCFSILAPVYARKSEYPRTSESNAETENSLTHYEDDFVQFDYDENSGIYISKFTGFGLIDYSFSDVYDSAFLNSTSNVEILINTESISTMDSYIDEISKHDDFNSVDDSNLSFSYTDNNLFIKEFLSKISDEYYMIVRYSSSEDFDNISSDLDSIVTSFTLKEKLPSKIPTDRETTLICAWYYTPEKWILENVESAIDICTQYRSLKIDLTTATKQVQEINNLLQKTSASSLISAALSALKSNTADLSDAIYLMQQFLDKQITSTASLTRSSKIK